MIMTSRALKTVLSPAIVSLIISLISSPMGLAREFIPELHDDFDRLDGHGRSGKKVDVVEWEGNLEIHVAPKGSLKGLALKLDEVSKDKRVMVIGYRFMETPQEQLVRRAILGIDLREGFKAYQDDSVPEYDKIIVSNQGLSAEVHPYSLEPGPRQLYPDGHPALAGTAPDSERKPATAKEGNPGNIVNPGEGTIQPFFTQPGRRY